MKKEKTKRKELKKALKIATELETRYAELEKRYDDLDMSYSDLNNSFAEVCEENKRLRAHVTQQIIPSSKLYQELARQAEKDERAAEEKRQAAEEKKRVAKLATGDLDSDYETEMLRIINGEQ